MRQGRIISRRSLELRLAYKAALVLRLSAEVVALRATPIIRRSAPPSSGRRLSDVRVARFLYAGFAGESPSFAWRLTVALRPYGP